MNNINNNELKIKIILITMVLIASPFVYKLIDKNLNTENKYVKIESNTYKENKTTKSYNNEKNNKIIYEEKKEDIIKPEIDERASQNSKVTLYLFYGDGCPHCTEFEDFIDNQIVNNNELKNKVKIVKYEVWYNEANFNLGQTVATKLGTQFTGVPFYVIGDKTFSGYASSMNSSIIETIENAYNSNEYVDIVNNYINR